MASDIINAPLQKGDLAHGRAKKGVLFQRGHLETSGGPEARLAKIERPH